MTISGNKGEWAEAYVALKILGDQKLNISNDNFKKSKDYFKIINLFRKEKNREIKYQVDSEKNEVLIYVNKILVNSKIPVVLFSSYANQLKKEIINGTNSFQISSSLENELKNLEITSLKGNNKYKSDIWLTVIDPRTGQRRNQVGFSIKSMLGIKSKKKGPTLFNTAKASAAVFKLNSLTPQQKTNINSIVRNIGGKNSPDVKKRWQTIINNYKIKPRFCGFRYLKQRKYRPFEENLTLLNPNLINLFAFFLEEYFSSNKLKTEIPELVKLATRKNPLRFTHRPHQKYSYMIKSFLYAAYCGMTASTLWSGTSEVNGGYIIASKTGEVLCFYAMESESFKKYLYRNCYMEIPSTSPGHGDYGEVYEEKGQYYFRLNFQIRFNI